MPAFLSALGVTVVYVTHDQQEAMTLSDRVAVFHNGMIEQAAPPEVLYEERERAFVARFIGENNRLDGVVVSEGVGRYIAYSPARRSGQALIDRHAETGTEMWPHMPTNP